jgi:hypothetical protein
MTAARSIIGVALVATFVGLALVHVFWALGGRSGAAAAVPSVAGKPSFRPSPLATVAVAVALLAAALSTAAALGWLGELIPARVVRVLTLTMSLGFLLRAIGDFKYVGFFKSVRGTLFAYWDGWFYSPLCLLIAAASFLVAW